MRSIKVAPSILSADFTRLGDDVAEVILGGADYIHFDVMDGFFVPNISIGIPVLKSLRKHFPDAVMDVHLMINEPFRFIDTFADAGADILSVHFESDDPDQITRAIKEIKERGCRAGLAIKPKTEASAILPWIEDLDMVLVMTVEPGFGGQSFQHEQLPKIQKIRKLLDERNPDCDIEVDGGISMDTAPLAVRYGANVLVAGSAVFGSSDRAAMIHGLGNK